MEDSEKLAPLEAGLLAAMRALDNQITREIEKRTPEELEAKRLEKWEPIDKRVERVSAFVLDHFGDETVKLDSVLVLTQAFAKCLQIICTDLGDEGLGKTRSAYCKHAWKHIERDTEHALRILEKGGELM